MGGLLPPTAPQPANTPLPSRTHLLWQHAPAAAALPRLAQQQGVHRVEAQASWGGQRRVLHRCRCRTVPVRPSSCCRARAAATGAAAGPRRLAGQRVGRAAGTGGRRPQSAGGRRHSAGGGRMSGHMPGEHGTSGSAAVVTPAVPGRHITPHRTSAQLPAHAAWRAAPSRAAAETAAAAGGGRPAGEAIGASDVSHGTPGSPALCPCEKRWLPGPRPPACTRQSAHSGVGSQKDVLAPV